MQHDTKILTDAVRLALGAAAIGVFGFMPAPSYAQDDEATLDRVEVLGSRIRRAEG